MPEQTRHTPIDQSKRLTAESTEGAALNIQHLGPYNVTGFIGRGGSALVYAGTDTEGAPVALKIMDETPLLPASLLARFKREAEAAKELRRHPNIITIYDTGQVGATHYIAMELVPGGKTLDTIIEENRLDLPETLRLAIAIAKALDYAHQHGIIHRDLKPTNILLSEFDEPLLADFGLARMGTGEDLTLTHSAIGTPSYMAPEQTVSSHVDAKCDMYSFGVVLYQMLTGKLPYDIEDNMHPGAVFKIIREVNPIPPRSIRRDISLGLQAIIMTLLEKEPQHRYQSMGDVADDLEAVRDGRRVSTHRPNIFEQCDRLIKRHWLAAIACLLVALTALGATMTFRHYLQQERLSILAPTLDAEKKTRELYQLRQSLKGQQPSVDNSETLILQVHEKLCQLKAEEASSLIVNIHAQALREGDRGLEETALREMARLNLARKRFKDAANGFETLAARGGSSYGAQLAQFELGLTHMLNRNSLQARKTWTILLETPDLPPHMALLCKGALRQITPDEFAAGITGQPTVIRALGYYLLTRQTWDKALKKRYNRRAEAAAKKSLPWILYYL